MRVFLGVVMALLQVGDFLSTKAAFARGAVELNPLLGFGMQPGSLKLAIAKSLSVLVFSLFVWRTRRIRVAVLLCLLFAAIVCSNVLFQAS